MRQMLATRLSAGALGSLCALLLAAPLAAGHELRGQAPLADTGSITGSVVNGTQDNTTLSGQQVTLQITLGGQAHDLTTVTTDGQGHFSFDHLATDPGDVYAVYTRFQGGLYSTSALRLDSSASQQTTLSVYDATTSDANLHVNSVTMLLRQPRPVNGLMGVGEFVSVHNSGNTAFVGSMSAANGMPMGLLRFALPNGATNLTVGLGFVGAQVTQVDTGFGATATVPPGDQEFAFAFDMPYDGTQAALPYKAEYATDNVTVLALPSMKVSGAGFTARGNNTAFGTSYQVFQTGGMNRDDVRTLALAGLPAAGQPSDLSFPALVGVASALALLIALLVVLYLKRGALALARAHQNGTAARRERGEGADEHQTLLRTLLTLERDHAKGSIDEATYRRRTGEVRAALRAVLAEELAGAEPSAQRSSQPTAKATTIEAPAEAPAEARTLSGGDR